jgi:hypothetical protein
MTYPGLSSSFCSFVGLEVEAESSVQSIRETIGGGLEGCGRKAGGRGEVELLVT